MEIQPISKTEAKRFVVKNHYSNSFPSTVKIALGFYLDNKLKGVALWGYGVRPVHTIKKLFPSLNPENYLELNRLCLTDDMPRNSESQFIKQNAEYIKQNYPLIKVLFSWADGLRGKPGFVYQASNWLYGGFIKSEFYINKDNEVIHPRLLRTRYKTRKIWIDLGLRHVWGYQFRYIKFICSNKERKLLLKETPINWNTNYPKMEDLKFWIQNAGEVSREIRQLPILQGSGQFRNPAPLFAGYGNT